jgi:hypothetical protein
MKFLSPIQLLWIQFPFGIFICLCLCSLSSFSQISSGTSVQNLCFGAFSQGSIGGTVIISASGSRSVTGSVVPLNLGVNYSPAIFEIEAPEGTIVSIMKGGNVTLTGSNGGSMMLQIGNSDPPSPFAISVPPPGKTRINFGGTLTIGSLTQNPPGSYSGTFSITFNNE